MQTPPQQQSDTLEDCIERKESLLRQYKALKEPLEFAQDDFEAEAIQAQMAGLASEIKTLSEQIRTLQSENG